MTWMRDFFNQAGLVYCDGMGVKLGARLVGYDIRERFTLADWIWELAALAASRGFRLYLLGNPPGVAERAAHKLHMKNPLIEVVGVHHGFFDHSPEST